MRWGWLTGALVLLSCGNEKVDLLVDVRTDLVPGAEFVRVEAFVDETPAGDIAAGLDDDYFRGLRVARLEALAPANLRRVRVSLLDRSGSEVVGRDALVVNDSSAAVTIVVTRDCRGVECPLSAGDPASACLGGQCVVPDCVTGAEDSCPMAECESDGECPSGDACSSARCVDGVCVLESDASACAPGEYCNPDVGCEVVPTSGGFSMVEAGQWHTCGIYDGAAYCWGANDEGRLGDGTRDDRAVPTAVVGLPTGTVTSISTGSAHSCAVVNGDVYCWGAGSAGQLGDDTNRNSETPVQVLGVPSGTAIGVSAGDGFSCAHTIDAVFCWGANGIGQLGTGDTMPSSAAVPTMPLWGAGEVRMVSAGQDHGCALVADAGWCWGHNDNNGALGDGSGAGSSLVPVQFMGVELDLISIAGWHSCGISTTGAVYCSGRGSNGILGNGVDMDVPGPVPANVLTEGTDDLACGGGPDPSDATCAIRDGEVFCWGNNQRGRSGIDPIDVPVLEPTPTGLRGAVMITAGYWHACAVLADGSARCWGAGDRGQLGNGGTSDSLLATVTQP